MDELLKDEPELMTAKQVADVFGTTVKAVYAQVARGQVPGVVRLGRKLRFVRAELVRFIEQRRVL